MMKQTKLWTAITGAAACALVSLGEVSVVSDVSMEQSQGSRLVTITYTLDHPGIVTLDIQTNGVSIGAANFRNVSGDVNREVTANGKHTITWRPDKSWEGHRVDNAAAKVSVWDKSTPPNYMTVGLMEPYALNWYTCEDALPEGINSDRYREDVLLMRKISQPDGGKFVMGSPVAGEGWRIPGAEQLHEVTLTNDYWIGVFEITQKQWSLVKDGDNPSHENHKGPNWATRPVDKVVYDTIRGAGSIYPDPPAANSFLGVLCSRTGIASFDLPSEMQWEYACRAGTRTPLNSGVYLSEYPDSWNKNDKMDQVGRYASNGGETEFHARVGSYLPNAWGIYDMHGNVSEWCLDFYADDITALDGRVNTTPTTAENKHSLRGGPYYRPTGYCRSAFRYGNLPGAPDESQGFRVVCGEGF